MDPLAKILVVGYDSGFQDALKAVLTEQAGFTQFTGFTRTDTVSITKEIMIYDSKVHDRQTKEAIIGHFMKDDKIKVLLGPMAPLSEGKNLQVCNRLFLLDTPSVERCLMFKVLLLRY
jgi:hypothetical protein